MSNFHARPAEWAMKAALTIELLASVHTRAMEIERRFGPLVQAADELLNTPDKHLRPEVKRMLLAAALEQAKRG